VIRAKRRVCKEEPATSTSSEDEERCTPPESFPADPNARMLEQRAEEENKENTENTEHDKAMKRSVRESPEPEREHTEPILIQPYARLLQRPRIQPISLDEFTPENRDLYLREFLPPNPMMETNEMQKPLIDSYTQVYRHEEDGDNWPIVSV
jgi:hypothetical protein